MEACNACALFGWPFMHQCSTTKGECPRNPLSLRPWMDAYGVDMSWPACSQVSSTWQIRKHQNKCLTLQATGLGWFITPTDCGDTDYYNSVYWFFHSLKSSRTDWTCYHVPVTIEGVEHIKMYSVESMLSWAWCLVRNDDVPIYYLEKG